MAVDEAILYAVGAGQQPPTLRVYGWSPPALSIGYGQRAREADREALQMHGWGFVRRPTGGRAILHMDELTYSIAIPADHPLARGGVIDSYLAISRALLEMLTLLGGKAHADRMTENAPKSQTPVCFDTPSHYEITVDGKKLIGSAQVRRANGILQHGSIPLTGDISRICQVLHFGSELAREQAVDHVRKQAITLSDALTREITWETASSMLIKATAHALAADFISGALSESENERAISLEHNVYGNDLHTLRR